MYYIIYTDWKCVKVQKKGSKYIYVSMVTDNLNWWLIAIKFSTLFLHLTFAVPIKLHLAARATITLLTSRVYPKERWITNGPLISNKSLKVSKLTCFNDIISPEKNQKLANLHWRILQTIYFHSFEVLMMILYIRLFWRWIYDDTGTLITLTIAECRRMLLSVSLIQAKIYENWFYRLN